MEKVIPENTYQSLLFKFPKRRLSKLLFFGLLPSKLSVKVYGTLSYLGIIFSYIYGYVFNKEKIKSYQIIGTIIIIFSNFMLLK